MAHPAWAADILALSQKINSSSKLIHTEKCYVLERLVDVTTRYVKCWIDFLFGEKTKSKSAVGEKLLGVLKRGLTLIQECGEKKYAKSLSTILYGAGDFCEIVDYVERYSTMMYKLYDGIFPERFIERQLQNVESDCRSLRVALKSAHKLDSYALINILKSSVKDTESNLKLFSSRAKLKRFTRQVLVERLERGLLPIGSTKPIASKIGNIDLLKETTSLGTGTFGTVSKAIWGGEMPVAVKEFFYTTDFKDEYNVLMKLMSTECSHVVQILGHSCNGIKKTLIMELMTMDLKQLIENKKETNPFSLYEVTDILYQIAKGIGGLHGIDVIHRDIKPANILVKENTRDKSWTVKLADFGASKAEFKTTDPNLHTTRGTMLYMAPEIAVDQFKHLNKYSKKVDVYSFGLVCIEILTGKHLNSVVKDLREGHMPCFLPSIPIPRDLYTMICDCLEPDENKRSNIEEICDCLWVLMEKILIKEDEIQRFSTEDEIRSYIDEKVELNFTRTLGGEEGTFMMPPWVPTPTGKTTLYSLCPSDLKTGLQQLPIDNLVDIELSSYLGIESSGRIKLLHPWETVQNPFIGTGVDPPNLLTGNLQCDLGIFGQLKKLVVNQGKKLNLSFSIGGLDNREYFFGAFSTEENRSRFITSVLELCSAYPIFNGLVVDCGFLSDDGDKGNIVIWEDGESFILLLKRLRNALPEGFKIGVISLEGKWQIARAGAGHLIDQIQLLGDLTSVTRKATHMFNLYPNSCQNWSIHHAINYYTSKGVAPSKIFIPAADWVAGFSNTDGIGKQAALGIPDDIWQLCPSMQKHHMLIRMQKHHMLIIHREGCFVLTITVGLLKRKQNISRPITWEACTSITVLKAAPCSKWFKIISPVDDRDR